MRGQLLAAEVSNFLNYTFMRKCFILFTDGSLIALMTKDYSLSSLHLVVFAFLITAAHRNSFIVKSSSARKKI